LSSKTAAQILQDKGLPSNFCALPFVAVECKTDGNASVCCVHQGSIPDFNFANNTISEAFDSKWYKDIQQEFLDNKQPAGCRNCFNEEKAGIHSKREREIIRLAQYIPEAIAKPEIKYLDLKFGNTCNLKCRTCCSFSSSKWGTDEAALNPWGPEGVIMWNNLGKWPKDNSKFWNDLFRYSESVDWFELFGGEPMVLKEHMTFLTNMTSTVDCSNKNLSYNTNGTQDMTQYFEHWRKFKKVQIFFSIDGVGPRFEYMRHPAKWDEVNANINKLLAANLPSVSVNFFCTVSAFNVWYLDEVASWAKQYPNCQLLWNMVSEPKHYSAKCLPRSVKDALKDRLLNSPNVEHFAPIYNYVDTPEEPDNYQEFKRIMSIVDPRRNEDYYQIFQEYARLLP